MADTINCDPAALAKAAACFCYNEPEARSAMVYLLAQIAGDASTPAELAAKAKCYCFDQKTGEQVMTYLLCQIAAGNAGCSYQDMQVAWEPSTLKLGEMLGFYTYADLPGITKIQFLGTTSLAGFDIESMNDMTELDFPNLVSIDPLNTQGGGFDCDSNAALTSLSVPALVSVAGGFDCDSNAALTSLSVPALVSVG